MSIIYWDVKEPFAVVHDYLALPHEVAVVGCIWGY